MKKSKFLKSKVLKVPRAKRVKEESKEILARKVNGEKTGELGLKEFRGFKANKERLVLKVPREKRVNLVMMLK